MLSRLLLPRASSAQIVGGRYGLGSKDTHSGLHLRRLREPARRTSRRTASPSASWTMSPSLSLEEKHAPDTVREGHHLLQVLGSRRQTVLSARTRTPSRSSATTPISISRHTSSMTPRRPAVSPFLTCVSVISRSSPPYYINQGGLCRLPQPVLHPEGLQDRQRRQAGRHLPAQLPVDAGRA